VRQKEQKRQYETTEKSKYNYIGKIIRTTLKGVVTVKWRRVAMCNYGAKLYDSEREAALSADMILIENGKEPVNILKRKI